MKQNVKYRRVRLLDLVEQYNAVRLSLDAVSKLAAFFVAYVTWR